MPEYVIDTDVSNFFFHNMLHFHLNFLVTLSLCSCQKVLEQMKKKKNIIVKWNLKLKL